MPPFAIYETVIYCDAIWILLEFNTVRRINICKDIPAVVVDNCFPTLNTNRMQLHDIKATKYLRGNSIDMILEEKNKSTARNLIFSWYTDSQKIVTSYRRHQTATTISNC